MSETRDPGRTAMLELFQAETESHGKLLLDGLDRLTGASPPPHLVEPFARAVQAVKGGALLLGLAPAARVTSAVESCLAAVAHARGGLTAAEVAVVRSAVELLVGVCQVHPDQVESWFLNRTAEVDRAEAAVSAVAQSVSGRGVSGAALGAVAEPAAQTVPALKPTPVSPNRPPGGPPTEALDLHSASLLDLFRLEVVAQTKVLSDGLLALEDGATAEGLQALMRAAHSVKGAARVVQLDPVVRLAHTLEDCLVGAQEGRLRLDSSRVDVLLAAVDLLGSVSEAGEGELKVWVDRQAGSLAALVQDLETVGRGGAPSGWSEGTGAVRVATLPPAEPEISTLPQPGPGTAETTAAQPAPARPEMQTGREVRISADNLDRLMGLAGESLVQAGWLESFGTSLAALKKSEDGLAGTIESHDPTGELGRREELGAAWQRAREQVNSCRAELLERIDELSTFSRRALNLSSRLYRAVIASRMRPFEDAVGGFRRLVRDLSRSLGKRVRLELRGLRTEVDRDIVEKLEAPLNHLLRNAVDHGIEAPEERRAAGKAEAGTIVVDARHRAGKLVITVTDDGRGVDLDRLRVAVSERRIASEDMVARMNEAELLEFLFLPGFSTAERVTEISGRGVGLDVVQAMVHEVGGSLRATTRPGEGLTFALELPLTRSVMRALLVEVAGEPLAIPLARIDRTLKIGVDEVDLVEDRQYYRFEGDNIGLVSAHQVLEMGEYQPEERVMAVVVLSDQMNRYGLVVDRFVGEHDLVVRPLDRRLGKVADVAAVAVLPTGAPVLIVEVDDLVRSIDNLVTGRRLRKIGRVAQGVAQKRVLVVDDSLTVREVERQLLANRGYEVDVAVDGMDGWNAVLAASYDLVITDVDMPRMSGFDLVERIKADPDRSSTPVIIVSYKDREEDRLRGLEVGADYYLTKGSFHDDTLLEAVVDLVGPAVS